MISSGRPFRIGEIIFSLQWVDTIKHALGAGLGIVFGVLFNNIALGLCLGVAIGAALDNSN